MNEHREKHQKSRYDAMRCITAPSSIPRLKQKGKGKEEPFVEVADVRHDRGFPEQDMCGSFIGK